MQALFRVALIIVSLTTITVYAHPGRQDSQGGHYDKKTGQYHCHKEPCFSNQKQVQDATVEAETTGVAFSPVYHREDWKHWSDLDHDCMNTRHEILLSQASESVKLSPDGCYVSTGTWFDPYSGKTYHRASDLDIDHIVPLKWANDHGGYAWTPEQKKAYANDPDNLLAVDDSLNQQKGAQGPDEWMPPNQPFRCEYLKLWAKVLHKYSDLHMTPKEERIFTQQRQACGVSP